MSNLSELFDYKNQLMHDILSNEEIVALLQDDQTDGTAEGLAYQRVFPHEL